MNRNAGRPPNLRIKKPKFSQPAMTDMDLEKMVMKNSAAAAKFGMFLCVIFSRQSVLHHRFRSMLFRFSRVLLESGYAHAWNRR